MVATHILASRSPAGEETVAHLVAGGRASALFAVLAGVTLALGSGGRTPFRGRDLGIAAAGLAARAVLVALIGLWLGGLESGLAIILTYYGVLFLLGLPFLALRARDPGGAGGGVARAGAAGLPLAAARAAAPPLRQRLVRPAGGAGAAGLGAAGHRLLPGAHLAGVPLRRHGRRPQRPRSAYGPGGPARRRPRAGRGVGAALGAVDRGPVQRAGAGPGAYRVVRHHPDRRPHRVAAGRRRPTAAPRSTWRRPPAARWP